MFDEIGISKFDFDQYWVAANLDRIERLMTHEMEALIDHHWKMLLEAKEANARIQDIKQGKERKE